MLARSLAELRVTTLYGKKGIRTAGDEMEQGVGSSYMLRGDRGRQQDQYRDITEDKVCLPQVKLRS